jgi:hypothetical protein
MNSLGYMTLPQRVYLRLRGISEIVILNEGEPDSGKTQADLLKNMDTSLSQFRAAALDDSGAQVDYGKLGDSPTFRAYRQSVVDLSSFDLNTLATYEDRLAFWINLYNALMIHIVIDYGVEKSILSLRAAYDRAVYRVGGLLFSANDIEHGILRANRGHPLIPGPQFGRRDARRRFMVSQFDPRIHFALNCAARSCPPIRWYTSDKISRQLDLAAANFVNDGGVIIAEPAKKVYLSRIFAWYAADFGGPRFGLGDRSALIQYIIPFVQPESRKQWLIDNFGSLRVRFSTYDWSLNGTR